jgi:hypothetical protein
MIPSLPQHKETQLHKLDFFEWTILAFGLQFISQGNGARFTGLALCEHLFLII